MRLPFIHSIDLYAVADGIIPFLAHQNQENRIMISYKLDYK
jgi:hypothetical protein